MRHFSVAGRTVAASHAWRTHPKSHGSRRFTWIFRMCQVVRTDASTATIQLVGLKSAPLRTVPISELEQLPEKPQPILFELTT